MPSGARGAKGRRIQNAKLERDIAAVEAAWLWAPSRSAGEDQWEVVEEPPGELYGTKRQETRKRRLEAAQLEEELRRTKLRSLLLCDQALRVASRNPAQEIQQLLRDVLEAQ